MFINREDTTGINTKDLRRNIGYVIQQIGLFPNMTIEQNITVVPQLLGWDKARYRERARELMVMISMEPDAFLKRFPSELSGGQQQRIGVARALAADPPVMLMDEPFSAIDPINRAEIQDELLKMQQELKKTIIFVSHDIDEAIKMGDKVSIFHEGKLVQHSSFDDLLAAPKNAFVESFLGENRTLKRRNPVKVHEVVSAEIATVSPGDTMETALARIDDYGYQNAILMVNDQRQPVGLITRAKARTTKGYCRDHFENVPATVSLEDDLRKLASLMFSQDATWLPCVDGDGRVYDQITQRTMTYDTPVIMANRFGPEGQSHFWGGSRILGPRGELLAETEECEMLITAELSRTAVARARFELPTHRDANTPLVRELMAGYR